MIVYFIGGSLDLTKRAMRDYHAPPYYFAALLEPLGSPQHFEEMDKAVTVKRERYHCVGELRVKNLPPDTYIYVFDGIE
jgi:hypothetical protein